LNFRIGDTFIVEIVSVDHLGRGVTTKDGTTIIVPEAMPGQRVRVRVTKVRSVSCLVEVVEQMDG